MSGKRRQSSLQGIIFHRQGDVREVDDDWWPAPACGSLSVNSYGQLKPEEINEKYDIYFAHPTENSLDVVDKIVKEKKNKMFILN